MDRITDERVVVGNVMCHGCSLQIVLNLTMIRIDDTTSSTSLIRISVIPRFLRFRILDKSSSTAPQKEPQYPPTVLNVRHRPYPQVTGVPFLQEVFPNSYRILTSTRLDTSALSLTSWANLFPYTPTEPYTHPITSSAPFTSEEWNI